MWGAVRVRDIKQVMTTIIDGGISYRLTNDDTILFEPWRKHPKFKMRRDYLIQELIDAKIVEPGDKLVSVEWAPENILPLKSFGLVDKNGKPKLDPVLTVQQLAAKQRDTTKKGSWVYENALTMYTFLGAPIYSVGVLAKIDNNQCGISGKTIEPIAQKHRNFWVEVECITASQNSCRSNNFCPNGKDCSKQEDCIDFASYCTSVVGPGASGNINVNLSAGLKTKKKTRAGTFNFDGKIEISDWSPFTVVDERIFTGRLCACVGNPYTQYVDKKGVQRERNQYGTYAGSKQFFLPSEQGNKCGLIRTLPAKTSIIPLQKNFTPLKEPESDKVNEGEFIDTKPEKSTTLPGTGR